MIGRRDRRRTSRRLWLAAGTAGLGLYALSRAAGARASRHPGRRARSSGPRIVILGAGFAGMAAAHKLRERLGDSCRILLVDRNNYHLFTPLLFQVSTCDISPYDVAFPVRQFIGSDAVEFRKGTVAAIDLDNRTVQLTDGEEQYDYLVVALGTTTNFFGNRSALQHALPMKELEDAVTIRHRVIDALEAAASATNPDERRALVTFAVVGGGATGVETAGALAEYLNRTARAQYPVLNKEMPRVVLIEAMGKLLSHMGDRLATLTEKRLRQIGVEVWLNTMASEVIPGHLTTEDGRRVPAGTIVWATGVRAPDLVAEMDAPHGKGGSLVVNQYLQVEGRPEVYAVGDNAQITDFETGESVPLLAQSAEQGGQIAAENLARIIQGLPQVPFAYRSRGTTVSIGRNDGVAEIGGIELDGLAGNMAWRLVHLRKVPGFRNQLATAINWGFSYVYHQHTARLELEPVSGLVEQGREAEGEDQAPPSRRERRRAA
jgi:NADH:ubiquinone reductase (H+-translocating)